MSTNSAAPKKLFIKTWGCQMNVYDSHRMADALRPLGYQSVDDPDDADMLVLNTCHIREKATDKVFSELGRLNEIKSTRKGQGKQTLIAVAGCVAQAEGDVITARAPYVDMVFGPQTYGQLPEMVAKLTGAFGPKRIINTDFPIDAKFDLLPGETGAQGPCAFLSIQEGCDKFCTYCVVPYTRGSEFSRPVSAILDEARRIIDTGAREITLLGQNVNAFHGEGPDGTIWGLGHLIAAIAQLDGIDRIRYMTSHPSDMQDDLIAAHRDVPKLMPFMHLPVQSGSDTILKAMNRKHTADDYKRLIDKIRDACPTLAFSSDFIVGFPGETDTDHAASLDLIRHVGYASAYSFKFSARPGTPAANMGGLVPESVKAERLQAMQDLIFAEQKQFNTPFIGRSVPVLFDRFNAESSQLHGRTPWNQALHCTGAARLVGQIMDVDVTDTTASALSGKIDTRQYL